MEEEKASKLVIQHTDWFVKTIRMIYEDAMFHGYKHGYEQGYKDAKKESER